MRMSPVSRWGARSAMVFSTAAAGTISHTARGFLSFFTSSASEAALSATSTGRKLLEIAVCLKNDEINDDGRHGSNHRALQVNILE